MRKKVRISQCMIVKNEEKNIRRALSWGKGFLYEQIVVDTGSTDRTVEIAEEMGAKVYHFDWIGDFSAAKNYAIGKATGDWIAFLDADEYFLEQDVKKLYKLLEKLESQPAIKKCCVIQSSLLELNDDGKVFSTTVQQRFFSNSPKIRYINKIHEKLYFSGKGKPTGIDMRKELSVYHTGYSASAYRETRKLDRNIEMLYAAVEENPEDGESWSYLGDSLYAAGRLAEAEKAYEKSLPLSSGMSKERRQLSYFGLVRSIGLLGSPDEEMEEKLTAIYERAVADETRFPDLDFWLGEWMYLRGKRKEAVQYLETALKELEDYRGYASLLMTGSLEHVYGMLAHCSLELRDRPSAVRYGVLVLRINRYADTALDMILVLLKDEPGQCTDPSATYDFLTKLYDFTQIRDRLFVMKAAKKMGFDSLYDLLYDQMEKKDREWLDAKPQSPYYMSPGEMEEKYPDIPYVNETDFQFATLIEEVKREKEDILLARLKEKLSDFQKKQGTDYWSVQTFLGKYPFWGTLCPEAGEYGMLEQRIQALKGHEDEFVWLYSRLADNRSRMALYGILDNWLHFSTDSLTRARENGAAYFDTDIIPSGKGDVFVDLGAYTGDSAIEYIKTYGECYGRIYCYEITPEAVNSLKRSTRFYHDIEIRQKAAGGVNGTRYIRENPDMAANQAVEAGEIAVEMVTLDEDINEPVSFIKMDIEGGEHDALKGCREHIRKEHPKLAVSIYHGYEDIWKIPRLIADMNPDYHFYLRNYGGNLIPTEFILYAV